MANLKFGSSFLSGINPALDNLTKIGAAPTDQQLAEDALYGVRGTRNPLARSVGGLLSALGSPVDVRTSSERISQDLSQIQNPSSTKGIIEALKIQNQYLQNPTAKIANLTKIKEIERADTYRQNLIKTAKEFNLPEIVSALESGGDTTVYGEQIRAVVTNAAGLKAVKPMRLKQLDSIGITEKEAEDMGLLTIPQLEFEKFVTREDLFKEATPKAFTDKSGKSVIISVLNKSGKVYDPTAKNGEGGYVLPSEYIGAGGDPKNPGLTRSVQQTQQLTESLKGLGDSIGKASVDALVNLGQEAKDAVEIRKLNQIAVERIEKGNVESVLGRLSEQKLGVLGTISSLTGITFETIEDAEVLLTTRSRLVANYIQNFGSGTGLSDSDRKFAERAMLSTTEITVKGYLELIRIYNDISDTSINRWEEESNKILNATKGTQTQDFNVYLSVLGPSLSDIQGVRAISGINQRIQDAEEQANAIINAK
jgi:hypothetical protein